MLRFLWKVILIILVVGAGLGYWFYYNVYSYGDRTGTLIKISKKGNVFKTVEGEMWLSCRQLVNQEKFFFTVEDEKLADSLRNLQDMCLHVEYKEYRRTLPWRGDSKYIVTGFQRVTP